MLPRGLFAASGAATGHATRALLLMLLVLGVLVCCVSGDYGPKDAVVVLTEKNFEKEVLQSPDYWLVEFYAPWCGHCKKLEPEFKAAAKKLKKHARLGVVDATEHQGLAHKYGVKGYPTIKEFGAKKKKPRDYQGGRSKRDIVQYVKNSPEAQKLGVGGAEVPTLNFASVHAFLRSTDQPELPSAIFFGSPKKGKKASTHPPSWLSAVADTFTEGKKKKKRPTVQLAFVPGSDNKVAAHFGLEEAQLPAVLFVHGSHLKFEVSDMSLLNADAARQFITDALTSSTDAERLETLPSVPVFPSPEVPKKKPRVALKALDAANTRHCLTQRGHMCVVVANADEELVRSLAKKYRRDPFTFLSSTAETPVFQALTQFISQSEGGAQPDVVVVKAGRKVKYAALSGASDESSVSAFLDKLLDGSSPFSVPQGELETLEAALEGTATAKHEEL